MFQLGPAYHEAGYDSYVTGVCFIRMNQLRQRDVPCLNKVSFISVSGHGRQFFDFENPKQNCNFDPTLEPYSEFGQPYTTPLMQVTLPTEDKDLTLQ